MASIVRLVEDRQAGRVAEAVELDHDARRQRVQAAVTARFGTGADGPTPFIAAFYDSRCVFSRYDSRFFEVSYSIAPDGAVTLGEPKECARTFDLLSEWRADLLRRMTEAQRACGSVPAPAPLRGQALLDAIGTGVTTALREQGTLLGQAVSEAVRENAARKPAAPASPATTAPVHRRITEWSVYAARRGARAEQQFRSWLRGQPIREEVAVKWVDSLHTIDGTVAWDGARWVIVVNGDPVRLGEGQWLGILKHEAGHLVAGHIAQGTTAPPWLLPHGIDETALVERLEERARLYPDVVARVETEARHQALRD